MELHEEEVAVALIRAIAKEHGFRRKEKDLQVQPERPPSGVLQIETDHVVEARPATTVDLPKPRQARSDFNDPSPMPQSIVLELVGQRRARTDQRHLSF